MAFSAAGLNAATNGITAIVTHISLHTSDPGTTGAGEATGGGYVRKPINGAFPAAVAGSSTGGQVTWTAGTDLAAATAYTHAGYWTALTGGTFTNGNPLSAPKTPATGDQVKYTPTIAVA